MPSDTILVLNSGSSSVKFAVFQKQESAPPLKRLLAGQITGIGAHPSFDAKDIDGKSFRLANNNALAATSDHSGAIAILLDWLQGDGPGLEITAAGHRVVHGGTDFTKPERVTPGVVAGLKKLIPLAPHHQPHNVAAIDALSKRLPALEQVVCFDTAFHAKMPSEAAQLGLPATYADRGMRRYGFHGLSYEHVVRALPRITGTPLPNRLVIAHLGNGASMCAIKNGTGIATTMGFSTLDGLPMGTRSGSLDPGAILHVMREDGLDLKGLEDLLYNRAGLLGISGVSSDMRVLLDSIEPKAREAIDYYCYRITRELGSLVAALGGIDALIFTGGIGENAATVRADVINRSAWLGLQLDQTANDGAGPRITTPNSTVPAWIVPADEESIIARHTLDILLGSTA